MLYNFRTLAHVVSVPKLNFLDTILLFTYGPFAKLNFATLESVSRDPDVTVFVCKFAKLRNFAKLDSATSQNVT